MWSLGMGKMQPIILIMLLLLLLIMRSKPWSVMPGRSRGLAGRVLAEDPP